MLMTMYAYGDLYQIGKIFVPLNIEFLQCKCILCWVKFCLVKIFRLYSIEMEELYGMTTHTHIMSLSTIILLLVYVLCIIMYVCSGDTGLLDANTQVSREDLLRLNKN